MNGQSRFEVGLLVFPNITQLDLTGPWEVFSAMPGARVSLVWKSLEPVVAAKGLRLLPDATFAGSPQYDLLCVPGGPGMNPLLNDPETLDFLRRQAPGLRYLTSVCTGSLVLGAAGLLRGRRAASHWLSRDLLALFGAIPVDERVVVDGNVISGGGVTAGIDFALRVAAELHGEAVAQGIQLAIEYAPAPPFSAGTPQAAPPDVVAGIRRFAAPMLAEREAAARSAAAKL